MPKVFWNHRQHQRMPDAKNSACYKMCPSNKYTTNSQDHTSHVSLCSPHMCATLPSQWHEGEDRNTNTDSLYSAIIC